MTKLNSRLLALPLSIMVVCGTQAEEPNYLPSQFSKPLQADANVKRKLTAEELKALDAEIAKATQANLPVANKILQSGEMPSVDQKGRLLSLQSSVNTPSASPVKKVAQTNNALIAKPDENGTVINAYPQYTQTAPQVQVEPVSSVDSSRNAVVDKAMEIYKPHREIMAAPGEPVSIAIGVAQSNRISFNFNKLHVVTSNMTAPIIKDGGYMYITPTIAGEPIGLLVGEEGLPETMVNVLLLPAPVPAVIADIDVLLTKEMKRKRSEILAKQKREEEKAKKELEDIQKQLDQGESKLRTSSDPYVERIVKLLKEVAREDIPGGFTLRLQQEVPVKDYYPCDSSKLVMKHQTVMQLVSSKEIIDIVKITNDLNGVRSVEDEYCISEGVIAAATFRRSHLQPGQSTETYILRDKLYEKKHNRSMSRKRPTVTN